MSAIPRHDLVIVMDDLNAQIGPERTGSEAVIGPHTTGNVNDNGNRFVEFCARNNLCVCNSFFRHKDIHKKTWISPA